MATSIGTLFRIDDLESASDLLRKDVSALSDRVKQLESHARDMDRYIRRLESLLAQHGISFPAEEETAPRNPNPWASRSPSPPARGKPSPVPAAAASKRATAMPATPAARRFYTKTNNA